MEQETGQKSYLKKDLYLVLILTAVFCGVLIGLKIYDNQGGAVTDFASKIASYLIK